MATIAAANIGAARSTEEAPTRHAPLRGAARKADADTERGRAVSVLTRALLGPWPSREVGSSNSSGGCSSSTRCEGRSLGDEAVAEAVTAMTARLAMLMRIRIGRAEGSQEYNLVYRVSSTARRRGRSPPKNYCRWPVAVTQIEGDLVRRTNHRLNLHRIKIASAATQHR